MAPAMREIQTITTSQRHRHTVVWLPLVPGPRNQMTKTSNSPFIISSLDPFHDGDYILSGIPDQSVNPSFCRQFRDRRTVVKPGAIVGAWDVWVISTPWLASDAVALATLSFMSFSTSASSAFGTIIAPYFICPVPAGNSWTWAVDNNTAIPLGSFNESYEVLRLIGCGFEVTNTTAELYKQGECLAYRGTECDNVSFRTRSAAGYNDNPTVMSCHLHPQTVGSAQTLFGVINYPAADGALVVATQRSPPEYQRFTENYVPVLCSGLTAAGYMPLKAAGAGAVATAFSNARPHGVIFTGLSDQTTFTVTTRINVEVSPNAGSTDSFLASKPPAYDPAMLELYTRAAMALPAAVPVRDNAAGDWFRLLSRVVKIASPHVGILSTAFDVGKQVYQAYREHTKQMPKPVKTAIVSRAEAARPSRPRFVVGGTPAPAARRVVMAQTRRLRRR